MAETLPRGCGRPVFVSRDGGRVKVNCGSRVNALCPYCASIFRNDWKAIGRDGIINAPEGSVLYFVTLTAPAFGRVHKVPDKGAPPRRCPCGLTHTAIADVHLRGVALNPSRYDYTGQVAWNYHCGPLWSNTMRALRRGMPTAEYFGGWEFQERGARHLHVMLRVHHSDVIPDSDILDTARRVTTRDKHGNIYRWGHDLDIKRLTRRDGLPSGAFADNRRARILDYLLKAVGYTVKDSGHDPTWTSPANDVSIHFRLLDAAAEDFPCGACPPSKKCRNLIHSRWGARSRIVVTSRASAATSRPGWSPRGITRTSQTEHRRNYRRLQEMRNINLYKPHFTLESQRRHIRPLRS
ncbi:hypothetical protein ON058_00010 [Demequina sp. B12]|uniref:replication initiator n=1 Tax=Demequina sp. B12 TaxID=2992757 RepID=UPI00237A268D|nr:replication initiator [Demequina sp. B12]MDE0571798.1 hypothetical protein [Demequina sp. B12]